MNTFNFLVFNGLDFDDYKEYQTEEETFLKDILKALKREEDGYSTNDSVWMNRFDVLKNGDKSYVLVPSTIPTHNDIVIATTGKYAVYIINKDEIATFSKDDLKYFKENLPKQFNHKEREKRKKEAEQNYSKIRLRDTFRIPIMLCSDDTIEILRFLIIYKIEEVYKQLVVAGTTDNDDSLKQLFRTITKDSRLINVTITPEKFANELMIFFTPEIQFKSFGFTIEQGISTYYSLCSEGKWLRDAFLGISEKECRDMYKEFLKKRI